MKRLIAILLTSCMIAGITTPTGSEFMMELRANTEAAMNNMRGTSQRTEIASEGAGNFDRAIRDLYDNSMSVTDEEIIASAQKMDSDFAVIEKNVGKEAQSLIDDGVVGGGMLPKLQNCIDAMKQGVSRVHILDGRLAHCLLLEFFTEKGIGTAILNDSLF